MVIVASANPNICADCERILEDDSRPNITDELTQIETDPSGERPALIV